MSRRFFVSVRCAQWVAENRPTSTAVRPELRRAERLTPTGHSAGLAPPAVGKGTLKPAIWRRVPVQCVCVAESRRPRFAALSLPRHEPRTSGSHEHTLWARGTSTTERQRSDLHISQGKRVTLQVGRYLSPLPARFPKNPKNQGSGKGCFSGVPELPSWHPPGTLQNLPHWTGTHPHWTGTRQTLDGHAGTLDGHAEGFFHRYSDQISADIETG
jgi:hypothetical protein